MQYNRLLLTSLIALLLVGCSSDEETFGDGSRRRNQIVAYIDRHDDEFLFVATPPSWKQPERFPWDTDQGEQYPKITKEYFRCRGCEINPVRLIEQPKGGPKYYYDCGGGSRHGLPQRDHKEFIYPILIDLLNYLQKKTGKRVVITVGHRCPEHNAYVDPSTSNASSKHQIGAEVTFYVQGLEEHPEEVLALIFAYYQDNPQYRGEKEYLEFLRYDKDTDVSTPPWYNKEIFVKLYLKDEGRNLDNRHPYPYFSIQVRYDWDKKERVQYSWKEARNYLR